MKKLKRALRVLAAVLLLSVAVAAIYLQTTKPNYSGELRLEHLSAPVTVYHDDYGVPHIYGAAETDVYRAFGYLVAQERMFQMELIRRVSSGRLSEILGGSMLDVDRFFRMLDINAHADSSVSAFFSSTNLPYQQATLAYLDGINQYIEKGKTPLEFRLIGIKKEKYTLRDLYLIVDYMAFNFQMGFRTDPLITRIGRKLGSGYLDQLTLGYTPDQLRNPVHSDISAAPPGQPAFASIIEQLPVRIWTGSNAFAIAPSRSASGKTLLENDTHIGQQQPGVWFDAHLHYPGVDFYGSYLAGFPFAPIGHTPSFGWGVTMLENDDVDFFAERTVAGDSNSVLIRNKPEKMSLRTETIRVKDSADVTIVCRSTGHGPVCSDVMKDFKEISEGPVSVSWTLLKFPCNLFGVTYDLGRSGDMSAFRKSVSEITSPGLNVIYGDTSGNIAWYTAARFVKRNAAAATNLVLDGSDPTVEWQGFHPFEDNPRSENPAQGFVFSCNHQPDTFNGVFHSGYYLSDERARRLQHLLSEKEKYSLDDVQRITVDHLNPYTEQVAQELLSLAAPESLVKDPGGRNAAELLRKWKGTHEPDDIAPVIYYMWLYYTLHDCMADETGEEDFQAFLKTHTVKYSLLPLLRNDTALWWDDMKTGLKETRRTIVSNAFSKTIAKLTLDFGKDPEKWQWSRMHVLEFGHPIGKQQPMDLFFNVGPLPAAGGVETIDNQSFIYTDQFPVKVMFGPALRRCIDFARPLEGVNVLPSGQSGNPMSPHYDDQSELYANGGFRKDLMDENEIRLTCKDILVFR
ncbi:MAG: hypothetical protein RL021_2052 [Bacteroidota bacterium]|jgi:penicillin amidase